MRERHGEHMSAVVSTRESCGSATRRPGASAHPLTRRPGRRRAITAPSFTRSPWRSRAHHGALTCSRAAAGLIVDIITRRLGRHRGGAGHAHHGQVAARDHESDRVGRAGEVPDEETNQRPSETISPRARYLMRKPIRDHQRQSALISGPHQRTSSSPWLIRSLRRPLTR